MNGTEHNKNTDLGFSFFIDENHENKPALYMSGVDCEEKSCGFTLHDLNNFIRFLEGQRVLLKDRLSGDKQNLLFENVKDETNGEKN